MAIEFNEIRVIQEHVRYLESDRCILDRLAKILASIGLEYFDSQQAYKVLIAQDQAYSSALSMLSVPRLHREPR